VTGYLASIDPVPPPAFFAIDSGRTYWHRVAEVRDGKYIASCGSEGTVGTAPTSSVVIVRSYCPNCRRKENDR
jgi:hypothetical protein